MWEEQIEINFKHVEFKVNTEPPDGEVLHREEAGFSCQEEKLETKM